MNQLPISSQPLTPLPPDDLQRNLVVGRPNEDQNLPHIGLAAPKLDKAAQAAFIAKAVKLAPKFRTELLRP
jgi:hypothetical protein